MEPINPLWTLLASVVSIWLGYRLGFRQATIAAESLKLSTRKATPHLSSRCERRRLRAPGIDRYSIHTTVYNDGDFVARKVEGEWKLTLAEGYKPITKIVRVDSLSREHPWTTDFELRGEASFYTKPEYIFQVDIDLDYVGLEGQPERYRARYRYDAEQDAMVSQKLK